MSIGVYKIVNTSNGKKYIGSSIDLEKRWREHKWDLRGHRHKNSHLQNAWNLYGEENFEFKPLLYCDPDTTLFFEQLCLDGLMPEYNSSSIAGKVEMTEETRSKISLANQGNQYSLGYRHTEDTKRLMSKNKTGKKWSDEARARYSESCKGRPGRGVGRKLTDEQKRAISERQRGQKRKPHSEETKRKMSAARKKYWEEKRHATS